MKSSWVHRKPSWLVGLCKAAGFSFPVASMCVCLISLHTCWSCHVLGGGRQTCEDPLPVAALWLGGQEPAPTLCPAVHPQLLLGPPLGCRRMGKGQLPTEINKKQKEIPAFPLWDFSGWSTPVWSAHSWGAVGMQQLKPQEDDGAGLSRTGTCRENCPSLTARDSSLYMQRWGSGGLSVENWTLKLF